jgi:hypothetical protein
MTAPAQAGPSSKRNLNQNQAGGWKLAAGSGKLEASDILQ